MSVGELLKDIDDDDEELWILLIKKLETFECSKLLKFKW